MTASTRFVVVRARVGGRAFVRLSKTVEAAGDPHNRDPWILTTKLHKLRVYVSRAAAQCVNMAYLIRRT